VSKRVEPEQTEVVPRAERRTFTAEYKRAILEEIAACKKLREIGAILRREGLYSALITDSGRRSCFAHRATATSRARRPNELSGTSLTGISG
jgi:hypothetical protein